MEIGTFSQGSSATIPVGTDLVDTTGFNQIGKGAARYLADPAVTPSYVTAHPLTAFTSANGRGFHLSAQQIINPYMFGAVGGQAPSTGAAPASATDDYVPFQAMLDFAGINKVTVDWTGGYVVSQGLVAGSTGHATLNFGGDLFLWAKSGTFGEALLVLSGLVDGVISGSRHLRGTGNVIANRTWNIGLLNDSSERLRVEGITFLSGFYIAGYANTRRGNTNACSFEMIRPHFCGSGYNDGDKVTNNSVVCTVTDWEQTGNSNSVTQSTTFAVSNLPRADWERLCEINATANIAYFVDANGSGTDCLYVRDVTRNDDGSGTISVLPVIKSGLAKTGTLRLRFGGGVFITGNDAGVQHFGLVDAQFNGIGVSENSQYGNKYDVINAQSNGVGITFGNSPLHVYQGGTVHHVYTEANGIDGIYVGRSDSSWFQGPLNIQGIVDYGKWRSVPWYRDFKTDEVSDESWPGAIGFNGRLLNWEKPGKNLCFKSGNSVHINHADAKPRIEQRDWAEIRFDVDADVNRLTGTDSQIFCQIGTGLNGSPTGTSKFYPPSGWTVNGASSVSFKDFFGPALFAISWHFATSDINVKRIGGTLKGSQVVDPASLQAGGLPISTTIAVLGATMGDLCSASFNLPLQGVQLSSEVVNSGNVQVTMWLPVGFAGPVDLGSGTLSVAVWH